MKNFVTGDIHGSLSIRKLGVRTFKEGTTLTKEDNVIILGDFGVVWSKEQDAEEFWWLTWLKEKPWTTLVVDGNHENFDRLYELPEVEMFGGTVRVIHDSVYWLQRGQVYNINGDKCFVLGGGLSIDKAYRTEGKSWWPQERPSAEELDLAWSNIEKHKEVDYVLTHVATPYLKFSYIPGSSSEPLDFTEYHLGDMLKVLKFKKHYHGHYHQDRQVHDKHISLNNRIIRLGEDL